MSHELYVEHKQRMTITDVSSVDGFDETSIIVNLKEECVEIYGKNLHIETLDLDEGKLIATGEVETINYSKRKERKHFFERFKI